jgi:DNA-directed RNA polymerase subunit H (RpoH/RPB5)
MSDSGFHIYENLLVFIEDEKYRNLKVLEGKVQDEREYVNVMEKKDYVLLKCEDANKKQVYVIIFSPKSRYVKTSKEFNMIEHMISKKEKEHVNLILITHDSVKGNITGKMDEFKNNNIHATNYTYELFRQVLPEAKNVTIPKHRIIRGEADIQKILSENNLHSVEQLPKISVDDPQTIWIDGKIGDIIEIIGPSDSAGKRIAYRRVS